MLQGLQSRSLAGLAGAGSQQHSAVMDHSSDDIIALYERHATGFDADRGKSLFEKAWLDRFLAAIDVDASVLDIGCGSGEPIARYFVEVGRRVTGVDSSATLIGLCRERFPAETWTVADMRQLDLGRQFGGILAWDSFFHLKPEDQRAMFPIFRAHAGPGAALMFTSGPSAGEAIGSYRGDALYHASLDPAEYRFLLGENGFTVIAHVVEDAGCGGRTIWLARVLQK